MDKEKYDSSKLDASFSIKQNIINHSRPFRGEAMKKRCEEFLPIQTLKKIDLDLDNYHQEAIKEFGKFLEIKKTITDLKIHCGVLLGRDIANLLATSDTAVEKLTVRLEFCEDLDENEGEPTRENGTEKSEQQGEEGQGSDGRDPARSFFDGFKKGMAKAPIKTLKFKNMLDEDWTIFEEPLNSSLKTLDLYASAKDITALAQQLASSSCPLQKLKLNDETGGPEIYQLIESLKSNKSLTKLDITTARFYAKEISASLLVNSTLKSLTLRKPAEDGEFTHAQAIAEAFGSNCSIEKLKLLCSGVNDKALCTLRDGWIKTRCPLRKIFIEEGYIVSPIPLLEANAEVLSLECLIVKDCRGYGKPVFDEAYEQIEVLLPKNTSLKRLVFDGVENACARIAHCLPPHLHTLGDQEFGSSITGLDNVQAFIRGISNAPTLRKLYIRIAYEEDAILEFVKSIPQHVSSVYLMLEHSLAPFSDSFFDEFLEVVSRKDQFKCLNVGYLQYNHLLQLLTRLENNHRLRSLVVYVPELHFPASRDELEQVLYRNSSLTRFVLVSGEMTSLVMKKLRKYIKFVTRRNKFQQQHDRRFKHTKPVPVMNEEPVGLKRKQAWDEDPHESPRKQSKINHHLP